MCIEIKCEADRVPVTTVLHMTTRRSSTDRSAAEAIGDAAITAIDRLPWADLLAAITPERIGQLTGYSASSIRYRLNAATHDAARPIAPDAPTPAGRPRGWRFDREQLFLMAVDAFAERLLAVSTTSRDRYVEALVQLERSGTLQPLAEALESELGDYAVGGSDEHTAAETERMFLLALAACDGSAEVGRRLRLVLAQRTEIYRPVYETALRISGRELRPGVALADIIDEIGLYLDGVTQRRRFEPTLPVQRSLETALAIFVSGTRPIIGTAPETPTEVLLRALASRPHIDDDSERPAPL